MSRMTGQVAFAAPHQGLFALQYEGGFAVLRLLEAEPIGLGDFVECDVDALGGQDFYNSSRGCTLDAKLLALALDEAEARRLLA